MLRYYNTHLFECSVPTLEKFALALSHVRWIVADMSHYVVDFNKSTGHHVVGIFLADCALNCRGLSVFPFDHIYLLCVVVN